MATACDEHGYLLPFAMFILAVCSLIGIAALHMSTDEISISSNEVVARKNLLAAEAAAYLAVVPLLDSGTRGVYVSGNEYVNPNNNESTNGLRIMNVNFLNRVSALDPITKAFDHAKAIASDPSSVYPYDIVINPDDGRPSANAVLLNARVNVDKWCTAPLKGSGAEFATHAEEGAPQYEFTYVIDAEATLPGRKIDSDEIDPKQPPPPRARVILGYRYIPGAGS